MIQMEYIYGSSFFPRVPSPFGSPSIRRPKYDILRLIKQVREIYLNLSVCCVHIFSLTKVVTQVAWIDGGRRDGEDGFNHGYHIGK